MSYKHKVTHIRGDTWQRVWTISDQAGNPINFTDATARLHVRNSAGVKVAEASTADGRLTVHPTQGRIELMMPASAMMLAPGEYRFDIEVTFPSGVVRTYEQSVLIVLEDLTRD